MSQAHAGHTAGIATKSLTKCWGTATTNASWWCYETQMQITRLPITPDLLKKET